MLTIITKHLEVLNEPIATIGQKELAASSLSDLATEGANKHPLFLTAGLVETLLYTLKNGESTKLKESAMRTLVKIAGDKQNKRLLFLHPGLVDALLHTLKTSESTTTLKQLSASAIASVALADENKRPLYLHSGLLDALIQTLQNGDTTQLKESAIKCLFFLSSCLQEEMVSSPLVEELKKWVEDEDLGFWSVLTLMNLIGKDNPEEVQVSWEILLDIEKCVLEEADSGGWSLSEGLRFFRYYSVTTSKRCAVFNDSERFLPTVLKVTKKALEANDLEALEHGLAVLSLYCLNQQSWEWLQEHQLEVFQLLDLVGQQSLLNRVDEVRCRVEGKPVVKKVKSIIPNTKEEIKEWIDDEVIAQALFEEDVVDAEGLESYYGMSQSELKDTFHLNALQAVKLKKKLESL
jgi:hypothetical protein